MARKHTGTWQWVQMGTSKDLGTKAVSLPLCVQSAHHSASLTDTLVAADSLGAPRKLVLSPCLLAAAITMFRPTLLTLRTWQGI